MWHNNVSFIAVAKNTTAKCKFLGNKNDNLANYVLHSNFPDRLCYNHVKHYSEHNDWLNMTFKEKPFKVFNKKRI